jgi:hypothetical protein
MRFSFTIHEILQDQFPAHFLNNHQIMVGEATFFNLFLLPKKDVFLNVPNKFFL